MGCLVVSMLCAHAEGAASAVAPARAASAIPVGASTGANAASANARQETGSIRGVLRDADFDIPLVDAVVSIVETGQRATSGARGEFLLESVPAGRYTLVFAKDGYVRQVKADVVVVAGQLTDVDVELTGEFTDMDEFVVQDILEAAAGSETALLELRAESPALLDSIGSELMSRAGASDAASALRLVSGATVQDGKYAVVRGLPDRYVSSQMNGVRLPTADEDKRAVELDQFPSAVIESIQVSKTFTPDQQGDASGGAVNLRLRGVPAESVIEFKSQLGYNSNAGGRDDFLSYDGGGVSFWGHSRGREQQVPGTDWTDAVGVSEIDSPIDSKWTFTAGGKRSIADGVTFGGLASFFYERDSKYFDDGVEDAWWVETPGGPMTPQYSQGSPGVGSFKTSLFDITQGEQSVQWGFLGTVGVEGENHSIALTTLYTQNAADKATLAIDTRGKAFFFPGYDVNDPTSPGNTSANRDAAPYLRLETLEYTERTTSTVQLSGKSKLPFAHSDEPESFSFRAPEIGWSLSRSSATLDQPDKRQFGGYWQAQSFNPGSPPFTPPSIDPAQWLPFLPSENVNYGNLQRIWKRIEEDSEELSLDVRWPFVRWGESNGYLRAGVFDDGLERAFRQETFSNPGDPLASFLGEFDQPWSDVFPSENHPVVASTTDVDYDGEQHVSAVFAMADVPLSRRVNAVGGVRFERTALSTVNFPEANAQWFPEGALAPASLGPGDADVQFEQRDVLPSLGLEYRPVEQVTLRAAYSQTIARQTFKEITPVLQQEYLGGPVFIGNPNLGMSSLDNYDLRADYAPFPETLVSLSWFQKNVDDPIEYVQRINPSFDFTTAVNYPKGDLNGVEMEVRQGLGRFWKSLEGVSVGFNGTLIHSRVNLGADDIADLEAAQAPMTVRDMTNAPESLLNLYLTWDVEKTDTRLGLFYTVQGDTLVAGAGTSSGNFVPNVYARGYETLNFSLAQKLGKYLTFTLQAKNLTNPEIEEVYRSAYIGDDLRKSSYTKGIDYSAALSLGVSF